MPTTPAERAIAKRDQTIEIRISTRVIRGHAKRPRHRQKRSVEASDPPSTIVPPRIRTAAPA